MLAKLAGDELPLSGERSHAVARLFELGTRGRNALHNILAYPMFHTQLENELGDGLTMPPIAREGGPLTDPW